MWAILESLHLTFIVLAAGDTEGDGHNSCPREVLSLLEGTGKEEGSGHQSHGMQEHGKAPNQSEVREAFLEEETSQLG